MKKKLSFLFVIIFLCSFQQESAATLSVEVRSAAFFPVSSRFREVYSDVHPCYELEVNKKFCNGFAGWFNIDEFYKSNTRTGCGKTNLNILTFSLGPKYICRWNDCFEGYVGVGLSVAWARIHNFDDGKEYNTSAGLVAKVGCNYFLNESYFLDFFCDYNYLPMFHNRTDVGGFRTGIGIGRQF